MPIGPGCYDDLCTVVREKSGARGVLLIVFDSADGDGFSCQLPSDLVGYLPAILEAVAREIRRDLYSRHVDN
jgi:ABC-type amino acid transport substrate-binding protein